MEFKIPQILLETIKITFEKEGKLLATQVAKSLGLPPKDVINRIYKKTNIEIIEWDAGSRCTAAKESEQVITLCGRTTLLGTTKCVLHQKEQDYEPDTKLLQVRKLILDDKVLWWDEATNKVFTEKSEYIGWLKDGELYTVDFDCE